MGRSIRAAAVQLRAHDAADFSRCLDITLDATRAAAAHADLVVLPEGTLPGYVLGDTPIEDGAIDAALTRLRTIAAASNSVIVVGVATAHARGLRNSAVVIDADGSLAGRADKLFLWHFDRSWFDPGESIAPIPTAVGTLGAMICADGRLPTIASTLVDRGAVVLVMPTAWVTSGRDPAALENVQADLLARVRAYENGVPFIAANKCGAELGMVAYCGKSQIVGGDGEPIAVASEREAETLYATVALDEPAAHRTAVARPARRTGGSESPVRIAIAFDPLPRGVDRQLEMLDAAFAIAPDDARRFALLDAVAPLARVDDDAVLDPASLVAYRRAGYRLICWTTNIAAPWAMRLARARALELRLYVVVFDRPAARAFAVDPDGATIAGTFDGYRLASFVLDPEKTAATLVAPGTDVADGLDRIEAIIASDAKTAP